MTTPRDYAASSPSPYPNRTHSLFVTGGMNSHGSLNTVEVLTDGGWQQLQTSLPVNINSHCMVLLNSTTVLIIGGLQPGEAYSPNTYLFNSENEKWVVGPKLSFNRRDHSCGKLRKDSQTSEYSIIVAGGFNATYMSSVEILDVGASEWRTGPNLPLGIYGASMVEEPSGGVVLIGGSNGGAYLDTQ